MRLKKTARFFAVLLVAIALFLCVAPWQHWLQQKLIGELAQRGIAPVNFTLDGLGFSGLLLRDISVGEPPLKLAFARVNYSLKDIAHAQAAAVTLGGLVLDVNRNETGWQIAGVPSLPTRDGAHETATIPVTKAALAALPFRRFAVEESRLNIAAPGLNASLPFSMQLAQTAAPTLTLRSEGAQVQQGDTQLGSGNIEVQLTLDEAAKTWQGTWSIADISIAAEGLALPKLSARGSVQLGADVVTIKGMLASDDKAYDAAFSLHYTFSAPEDAQLVIERAAMPWGGGKVSVRTLRVPLTKKAPIRFVVQVEAVEVQALLRVLSGEGAEATGVISGEVPMVWTADGKLQLGKGALRAQAPGRIALPPDAIPGDNAQVALLREMLKNLDYTMLALDVDMASGEGVSVTLAVEGSNANVQNGRAIKLKVHLSGDLLELLQQNLLLMHDPKTFIEQETHE